MAHPPAKNCFYLELWDDVRAETLRQLKTKDDKWFNGKAGGSRNMNNHWAWYHMMAHQANHMGQIRLITGRLPRQPPVNNASQYQHNRQVKFTYN